MKNAVTIGGVCTEPGGDTEETGFRCQKRGCHALDRHRNAPDQANHDWKPTGPRAEVSQEQRST